jgi:hypothetical protein
MEDHDSIVLILSVKDAESKILVILNKVNVRTRSKKKFMMQTQVSLEWGSFCCPLIYGQKVIITVL